MEMDIAKEADREATNDEGWRKGITITEKDELCGLKGGIDEQV